MTLREIIRRAIGDGSALWVPTTGGPAELHKVTPGEPVPMELQRSLWREGKSFYVLARPVIVHDAWQPLPLATDPAIGKLLGLGNAVIADYAGAINRTRRNIQHVCSLLSSDRSFANWRRSFTVAEVRNLCSHPSPLPLAEVPTPKVERDNKSHRIIPVIRHQRAVNARNLGGHPTLAATMATLATEAPFCHFCQTAHARNTPHQSIHQ
jgi:hypothetical protein